MVAGCYIGVGPRLCPGLRFDGAADERWKEQIWDFFCVHLCSSVAN